MADSINTQRNLISSLVNCHFCIKNASKTSILKALNASNLEVVEFDEKFDWDFLSDENPNNTTKPFILFSEINEWCYLIWNVWDFEETKQMTLFLSKELNTKVYYFFIDPWIATCRWILTDKGKLLKSYNESHGTILNDEGDFEIETIIRNKLKDQKENEFWEDKFWKLYKNICQPIEILNKEQNILLTKGNLG
ncbi:hypothetical protein [Flavobacterium foetidum]|uniref:hypothetical protein n=1 Tax=Flavobacterium foetidum TaxID=2026681 RepID=UPI00107569FD|nr:hypothetical protein [Flavobacterium foetidum]KAF2516016.1 hypothetical protein E0W73_07105 [Flavobacterium foetidum]